MANLKYLWGNRSRHKICSKSFLRSWLKRIFTLRKLVMSSSRRLKLVGQGANIASTAEIGFAKITGNKSNLKIGDLSFIGRAELALHDRVIIGNRVCINDGVILLSASHDVLDPLWLHKKAPIEIGDYAWIATNAVVLPGVKIGKGAVIGAGAVVRKDVGDFCIVIGNPAREIEKKRIKTLEYNPCEFLTVNNAWLK